MSRAPGACKKLSARCRRARGSRPRARPSFSLSGTIFGMNHGVPVRGRERGCPARDPCRRDRHRRRRARPDPARTRRRTEASGDHDPGSTAQCPAVRQPAFHAQVHGRCPVGLPPTDVRAEPCPCIARRSAPFSQDPFMTRPDTRMTAIDRDGPQDRSFGTPTRPTPRSRQTVRHLCVFGVLAGDRRGRRDARILRCSTGAGPRGAAPAIPGHGSARAG